MGIFDRLFRSKQTARPPAPSTPATPPFALPAPAKIASFVLEDAVGTLQLASGDRVTFGRSACKGFEPVVGASVVLEQVAPYPRGWRAVAVVLDPADMNYDALLEARDQSLGLRSRVMETSEAAVTARKLGLITVLLRDSLPAGTQGLRAWAGEYGFPRDGFQVDTSRDLAFVTPAGSVLTYPGRGPFPKDGLDTRDLNDEFDYGCAFIGLGTGLPGMGRDERAALGSVPDVWAPRGTLRQLSRLVRILAERATGVVLHRAGDLVMPADAFVALLGDLDDPECYPFAAWLDVATTDRDGEKVYGTFGMDAFGLPDVFAPVEARDGWSRSRRHEAVLYACYRMVRENRELRPGEELRVPLRTKIGAWPVDLAGLDAAVSYSVQPGDGWLRLTPTAEARVDAQWDAEPDAVAVNTYQALFDRGLNTLVPSDLLRDVHSTSPEVPPHSVEVRARHDGRGFLIVTNGFGRCVQPRGVEAGCERIEVGAWVPGHFFELVRIVGTLASDSRGSASGPWKPGDTLAAPVDVLGIGGFVLGDGGVVDMGGGPSVRLLMLVPLAPEEYSRVRGGGAAAWMAQNAVDERRWPPFLARMN